MSFDQLLYEILAALKSIIVALAPAAIGSAVAQAWEKGLSLRDRLIQWIVGICVSFYVTRAIGAWFEFGDFVAQGVGFVLAMIAFKATPKFIAAASDAVASLPALLLKRRDGAE